MGVAQDWINGRSSVLLGELWGYALQLSKVREIAEDVRRELPSEWTDNDAQALALEILLSNAGLDGRLRFSGISRDGDRVSIQSTYFNPQLRHGQTSHRGFNPETNEVSFVPVHDVHDEVFDFACEQAVQHRDLYHDWEEVEIEAASLSTFLRELDGGVGDVGGDAAGRVPDLGGAKSNKIVNAVIALWGYGNLPPSTITVKERNALIEKEMGATADQNTIRDTIRRLERFGWRMST